MRIARLTVVLVAASVFVLSLPATPSVADDTGGNSTVILTFESDQANPSAAARAAVTAAGGTDIVRVHAITARTVAVTLDDTTKAAAGQLNAKLEDQSSVRAADTSTRFYANSTNDTYYGYLWNLNNAPGSTYGVDAEDAWNVSRGAGQVVAVVDTGITVHSDLTGADSIVGGNTVAGYDFISDPAYSGDGDGYDSDPTDVVPADDYHGTHVAGIVAAIGNNGQGVVGVAPDAKVQPLRVLGNDGGSEEDLIAAIRWAAGLSVAGIGTTNPTKAAVINLSLGGTGTCSYAMQKAINDAVATGTAVVVAAGNDGTALSSSVPANCANVIRVTASTNTGVLASFSNYGTSSYPATIAAPGGSATSGDDPEPDHWIVSTWHNSYTDAGDYTGMVGTSMAAPHVSGTLALMKGAYPSLTVAQLTTTLVDTAKPFSSGCSTPERGAGLANASAAVEAASEGGGVPVVVAKPTISGKATVGSVLSASLSYSPSDASVSWKWLRNGFDIAGATASSYRTVTADKDQNLSVCAIVHYSGKTPSKVSSSVKVAAGLKFSSLAKPKISGKYKVGHKLTVKAGKAKPAATGKAYQWLRNGKPIAKATGSTYRLVKADKKKKISVKVTVTRAGYLSRSATSSSHKVK